MSGRDDDSKRPTPTRFPFFGSRVKAMGSSGWEAYTIGFTLVGCIVAGAGLGWFLDRQFGTSYWLPILFLAGVAAGFREMFVVLNRISKAQDAQRRAEAVAEREAAKNVPHSFESESTEPTGPRPRIFSVPPPPHLSGAPTEKPAQEPTESDEDESVEQLIERLMDNSEEESKPEDEQRDVKQ